MPIRLLFIFVGERAFFRAPDTYYLPSGSSVVPSIDPERLKAWVEGSHFVFKSKTGSFGDILIL